MTREEAVKWLKAISTKTVVFGWDDYASQESQKEIRERCEKAFGEAIDLAIEALQAEYEDYEHATLVDIKEPLKVLVVRCKDCRHWNSETKGCKRNPSVEAWHESDFCKYGERREE